MVEKNALPMVLLPISFSPTITVKPFKAISASLILLIFCICNLIVLSNFSAKLNKKYHIYKELEHFFISHTFSAVISL